VKKMARNESIVKKREALKLTQEQLGRMIGVKANTVSQYETGIRKPKGKVAKKLSTTLGIPLEEII
jgi:transcriptional regulator with XRE-family HTH domain